MKITIKNTEYRLIIEVLFVIHIRIYEPYGNDTIREFDIEFPKIYFYKSQKNDPARQPIQTSDELGDPDDIPF